MNAPSLRLPVPVAGDSVAVKDALEAAHTFWSRGDRRQAIACVKLALEVADEAGDAQRVAMLARAVADLGTPSVPPPLPPPSRRPRAVSTVPPPPISGRPPPVSARPAPISGRPPAVSTMPPPPLASRPVPKAQVVPVPKAQVVPVPKADVVPLPAPPQSIESKPPPPPQSLESKQPPPPQPLPSTPPAKEVRRRVYVKLSVRDPSLLVVRPLADGESAPAGTREAFLVMADAPNVAADSKRGA
jgi:hypothetical protein